MRFFWKRRGNQFLLLAVILIWFSNACSITRDQRQGSVAPFNFQYELAFTTLKNIIIIPVHIEGQVKNFLFDTGAQLSIIQRDSIIGKTESFAGASKRTMELGREVVPLLSIGPVQFKDTHAGNGDLVGLKEKVPDFGGLIGQPIINKANWLIDYPGKKITLSSGQMSKKGFRRIKIDRRSGSPFISLSILGEQYDAIIDMGSSATFSIPEDHPLAKKALNTFNFEENTRDIYTLGGLEEVKELVGYSDEIRIDDISFRDVYTDIRNTSKLRLGMRFFKDCQIYIDRDSGDYWIKIIT